MAGLVLLSLLHSKPIIVVSVEGFLDFFLSEKLEKGNQEEYLDFITCFFNLTRLFRKHAFVNVLSGLVDSSDH